MRFQNVSRQLLGSRSKQLERKGGSEENWMTAGTPTAVARVSASLFQESETRRGGLHVFTFKSMGFSVACRRTFTVMEGRLKV